MEQHSAGESGFEVRATAVGAAALLICLAGGPLALAQEAPPPPPAPDAAVLPEPDPADPPLDPEPAELPEPAAVAQPEPEAVAEIAEEAETDAPADPAAPELSPEEQEALAAEERLAAERGRVRLYAARELERAEARVAQATAALDAAQQEYDGAVALRDALVEAKDSAISGEASARRELGNLARYAYTSGPTEWTLIETILEADSPADALQRAAMTQRLAVAADGAWDRAVAAIADLQVQIRQAGAGVTAARADLADAEQELRIMQRQQEAIAEVLQGDVFAEGDGVRAIAELCGDSDAPLCERSGWAEGLLTRDAVWVMRTVHQRWPQIETAGGYRAADLYPDHPSGRAVDAMVPDAGRSVEGAAVGDEIAAYFMERADQYGIMYMIWQQRVWVNGRDPVAPPQQWRMMGDRGDWTSNHMDHVHITVSTGVSGWDIYDIADAPSQIR
jgi:hypothetical protein